MFGTRRFVTMLAFLLPVTAQFGVGNRKQAQNTQFQEMQEMAKKQQQQQQAKPVGGGVGGLDALAGLGGGGMADVQKLLADALNDPETMESLKQYGQQFGGVLDQMMQMSPEELQNQMAEAMKLMTEGDIVNSVINQRESVLQALKASGTVTADEIAKYESDPEYFELKMRESFDTMKDMFSNPEYITKATEAVKSLKGFMDDPTKVTDMLKGLGTDWTSDEKIEEARLQLIRGDFNTIPGFKELFDTEEMQELIRDPDQWKELVQSGLDGLFKTIGGGGDGATADLGTPSTNTNAAKHTVGISSSDEL